MKTSLFRLRLSRRPAFTLVEMLVVIGIIAILAVVTLQVGTSVINAAKRARAANMATQIQTACLSYYTEYSVYPAPYSSTVGDYLLGDNPTANDSASTKNETAWQTLMCILCGNIHPSTGGAFTTSGATITNSRAIAFLTMKASDVGTNGSAYQDAPLNPLPFASPNATNLLFNIAMDADYDGLLGTTGTTSANIPNFQLSTSSAMNFTGTSTAGVAVWENCNGKTTSTNPNFWVHTY